MLIRFVPLRQRELLFLKDTRPDQTNGGWKYAEGNPENPDHKSRLLLTLFLSSIFLLSPEVAVTYSSLFLPGYDKSL